MTSFCGEDHENSIYIQLMELVHNVNNDLVLSTTLLIHLKVAHSVSIEGAMLCLSLIV
jgi:hypothetical protein